MNSFIVIEGLDGVGKSTLAKRLADCLQATLLNSPPCIICKQLAQDQNVRGYFDGDSKNDRQRARYDEARRAYYRFANLVMSELAEKHLKHGNVVMDRYWPSTIAYTALDSNSKNFQSLQDHEYPPYLKKPDGVILLTVDEQNRKERHIIRGIKTTNEEIHLEEFREGRENVLKFYRKFDPIEVDTSGLDPDGVLEAVKNALKKHGLANEC